MNWKHLSCALEGLHNKYEKINTLQTITSLLAFHPFFHFPISQVFFLSLLFTKM